MSDYTIDFDEILVEGAMGDEDDEDSLEFEPLKPLPVTPPRMLPMTGFPMRSAVELVEAPEKLFDFTTTKLNAQQQMYIMQYAVRGTKLGACQSAGVNYTTVSKWNEDEEFVTALSNAVEMSRDALEEELIRRAMNGSDRLMVEAIRASKPEKYGKRDTKDVNINGTVVHTWSDLAMQAKDVIETTSSVVKSTDPTVVDVVFEEV